MFWILRKRLEIFQMPNQQKVLGLIGSGSAALFVALCDTKTAAKFIVDSSIGCSEIHSP
jgi:hypothetical protein